MEVFIRHHLSRDKLNILFTIALSEKHYNNKIIDNNFLINFTS